MRRVLAAALLALSAVFGSAALAQTAVLDVTLNGAPTQLVGAFELQGDEILAPREDWVRYGLRLPVPSAEESPTRRVALSELRGGIRSRLDLQAQRLELFQPPPGDAYTLMAVAGSRNPNGDEAEAAGGALLDYDLIARRADGDRLRAASLLGVRAFAGAFAFEHQAIVADPVLASSVRLDTRASWVDPERMRRYVAGDFVTPTAAGSRAVRLLGLEARTDFRLRPDLVTAPLPRIGGSTAVPSTVDVFVDGVRLLSQPVEAGRFEVRQLPTVSGAGEVAVVVRDALGRESVQRLAVYGVEGALAQGMTESSLEAGRIRRRYGSASDDYGPLSAAASLRHGMTDKLTLEAHAEATRGLALAGAGLVTTFADSFSLAAHASASADGTRRGLALERRSRDVSAYVSATWSGAGFRDIAASQGDLAPAREWRVGGGASLGRFGTLGAALVGSRPAAGALPDPVPGQRVATLSWSKALPGNVQAFASAYRQFGSGGTSGFAVGLVLPFGGRGSASASVSRQGGRPSANLQAGMSALAPGDVGWRVTREQPLAGEASAAQQAEVEWRLPAARVALGAEGVGGESALRLSAQGSVVALGGRLQAAPPANGGVALVDAGGIEGVTVYRENRVAGRTDARGQLVLTDLLPFQVNQIQLDPLDLPMDVDARSLSRAVRSGEFSAGVVRFGLQRSRSALVVLHDARDEPLPLGASVRFGTSRALVGYDGEAWLAHLADRDNQVVVSWPGGGCSARFDAAAPGQRIGPVACR